MRDCNEVKDNLAVFLAKGVWQAHASNMTSSGYHHWPRQLDRQAAAAQLSILVI